MHLKIEPAELCQGHLQGNGVHGGSHFFTQVRIGACTIHCTLAQKSPVMTYA